MCPNLLRMEPSEFRGLIDRSGLSQSEVARRLDVSDRTIRRYVAGPGAVPTLVVRAVRHLIAEQAANAPTAVAQPGLQRRNHG
jgi:predicted transcriptional regulator